MKRSYSAVLALLLLSAPLMLLSHSSDAAIQCSDVIKDLTPCVSYLMTSGGGTPSSACCTGVTTLQSAASTPADRKAACTCIMSAVGTLNPNIAAAKALPGSCGVTLPFTVSPDIDCSKIN